MPTPDAWHNHAETAGKAERKRPVVGPSPEALRAAAHITQADRDDLVKAHYAGAPDVLVARKSSRILATRMEKPFVVETDRGPMTGVPGDWLVTNHPDDDAGSDLWSISDERFKATYEVLK